MMHRLKIEAIGDDIAWAEKRGCLKARGPFTCNMPGKWPVPWVCRLDGYNRGKFNRDFIDRFKDYQQSSGVGRFGIYCLFSLDEGEIYEVQELHRGSEVQQPLQARFDCVARRYFCRVDVNGIHEISFNEVVELCKKKN